MYLSRQEQKMCSFLEKFERISKKIVNCLLAPLRGARNSSAAPPPAALPLFFSRAIFSLASLEQGKDFIVSLPRPPVRRHKNSQSAIFKLLLRRNVHLLFYQLLQLNHHIRRLLVDLFPYLKRGDHQILKVGLQFLKYLLYQY